MTTDRSDVLVIRPWMAGISCFLAGLNVELPAVFGVLLAPNRLGELQHAYRYVYCDPQGQGEWP